MKQGLSFALACCSLWCGAALAGDTASDYFAAAYKECDKLAKADQASPQAAGQFSKENCYSWQAGLAFTDQANERNAYFAAALKTAPEYAGKTFNAALGAGMDPYEAVTVATAAYPQGEAIYAKQAIAYGADPAKVTTATAAGKPKK